MSQRRRLGYWLLVGWLVLPFVYFVLLITLMLYGVRELSPAHVGVSVLIGTPMLLGTARFVQLVLVEARSAGEAEKQPSRRRELIAAIGAVALLVLLANVWPRRTPNHWDGGSPFDSAWYFAPQTHYGFPFPIYRIFDSETPDAGFPKIGKRLFDADSFVGDLVFLAFAIYVTTVCVPVLSRIERWLRRLTR